MSPQYADEIELLSNRRRRVIIQSIDKREKDEVQLNKIVKDVMNYEENYSDKDSVSRNSVRVSLRQNHLPKLTDNEVIYYDENKDVISPARRYDTIVDTLHYIDRSASPEKETTQPHNSQTSTQSTQVIGTDDNESVRLGSHSDRGISGITSNSWIDTSLVTKIIFVETTLIVVLVIYIIL